MLCQIVKLASVAANNSVPERNNAVVKCKVNPAPSIPSADDANDTVDNTVPPAFVAVKTNDITKPSAVNSAAAARESDITATEPPSLAKPFASVNGNNSPPFDTVTVSNAAPDSVAANTGSCGDKGESESAFIISGGNGLLSLSSDPVLEGRGICGVSSSTTATLSPPTSSPPLPLPVPPLPPPPPPQAESRILANNPATIKRNNLSPAIIHNHRILLSHSIDKSQFFQKHFHFWKSFAAEKIRVARVC